MLDNVSQPEWVEAAYLALEGEEEASPDLISRLEREMRQAAERLDFERAANIRDRIYNLKNATN